MIISVNWLKKYTDIELPINELAQLIGERLVEIEEVIDLGARYQGVIIARAQKVYKHPNADKLNVVEIDDGGVASDVARLDNGLIQVVCGAPNVREGLLVAWIIPGATVPSSYSEAEPFVLGSRELRGVVSNGMLASAKELAINNEHDGILEIEGDFVPGDSFAVSFELNDYLLDIENKSLTHRPDCFGVIGFAREVAAIQNKPFYSPDWLTTLDPVLADVQQVDGVIMPEVRIEDSKLCPRYQAVVISGVDSTMTSPLVIQSYLKRVGVRPISAVVDVTNYLMISTGQPLHSFDYDAFMKVQNDGQTPKVTVRSANSGEKLTLLDGKTIDLSEGDIVICAGNNPVALAGAMGGAETEVTQDTKNILLESATFNLYNLRTTSMRHGIFSDAVTRFTKGQPAEQTAPVLASATRMLCDIAGGARASEVVDAFPGKYDIQAIGLLLNQVNATLGSNLTIEEVKETLINIECSVTPGDDEALLVLPPFWRSDLNIPEDLVEEIGRLRGFDTISPVLPVRSYNAVMPVEFDRFRSSVRRNLVRMGASEVLTYSFVHGKLLQSAEQITDDAFRIVNAISPDLQYYRTSLTPSLLDKVNGNLRAGYENFALFEMNKVHVKGSLDAGDDNLPVEHPRLSLVIAASDKEATRLYRGAPYYQAKYYLEELLSHYQIDFRIVPMQSSDAPEDAVNKAMIAPFEVKRSGVIKNTSGTIIGVIGEYKKPVSTRFKLPEWCMGFELKIDELFAERAQQSSYEPSSKFPGTERDICLRVGAEVSYQDILDIINLELRNHPYESAIEPVDIYQKNIEDEQKQVTVRVRLNKHESTITAEEANAVADKLADAAVMAFGAERV